MMFPRTFSGWSKLLNYPDRHMREKQWMMSLIQRYATSFRFRVTAIIYGLHAPIGGGTVRCRQSNQ